MKITGFIFLTAVALVFRQSALGVSPPGHVIGWGSNIAGEATGVPSPGTYYSTGLVTIAGQRLTDAVAIAAGRSHSLALRSDGTVAGWGGNGLGRVVI